MNERLLGFILIVIILAGSLAASYGLFVIIMTVANGLGWEP